MAGSVLLRRLFETCSCIRGSFSVVATITLAICSTVWLSAMQAGSDPDRELLESESTPGTHMSHRLSDMVPDSRFPEIMVNKSEVGRPKMVPDIEFELASRNRGEMLSTELTPQVDQTAGTVPLTTFPRN